MVVRWFSRPWTISYSSLILNCGYLMYDDGTVVAPLIGTTIVPGEVGYTEAALRRSQVDAEGLGFNIRETEAIVATLNGGSL
jgi:hypothetical protein